MSRLPREVIRLGPYVWEIRPLTLRQIQEIEPILLSSNGKDDNIKSALAILAIALKRDHGEALAVLDDVEGTPREVADAMATILRLGGFIDTTPCGDSSMGEGDAG